MAEAGNTGNAGEFSMRRVGSAERVVITTRRLIRLKQNVENTTPSGRVEPTMRRRRSSWGRIYRVTLPPWYRRVPLGDFTAIHNSLERRRIQEQSGREAVLCTYRSRASASETATDTAALNESSQSHRFSDQVNTESETETKLTIPIDLIERFAKIKNANIEADIKECDKKKAIHRITMSML